MALFFLLVSGLISCDIRKVQNAACNYLIQRGLIEFPVVSEYFMTLCNREDWAAEGAVAPLFRHHQHDAHNVVSGSNPLIKTHCYFASIKFNIQLL